MKSRLILALILGACGASASAQTYIVDPNHTYPSFEVEHMGISVWRGKFTKTSGKVSLDRAARTGTLDIAIEANSIDFGHAKLNEHAKSKDMFDVEKFPTITYKSKSIKFDGERPSVVEGELTLLGVTRPVTLTINKFKCIEHPVLKRENCGADASAEFKRTDFGLNYGVPKYAGADVKLLIQVEVIKAD